MNFLLEPATRAGTGGDGSGGGDGIEGGAIVVGTSVSVPCCRPSLLHHNSLE